VGSTMRQIFRGGFRFRGGAELLSRASARQDLVRAIVLVVTVGTTLGVQKAVTPLYERDNKIKNDNQCEVNRHMRVLDLFIGVMMVSAVECAGSVENVW